MPDNENKAVCGAFLVGDGLDFDGKTLSSLTAGTKDYNELYNKPKINNIELVGNTTLANLGAVTKTEFDSTVQTINNNITAVTDSIDDVVDDVAELNEKVSEGDTALAELDAIVVKTVNGIAPINGNVVVQGGEGGSVVVVTPKVTTGTNIADISIDGVVKKLYAPTNTSDVADVKVNNVTVVSNKVANIPVASDTKYGVVKIDSTRGIYLASDIACPYNTKDNIDGRKTTAENTANYFGVITNGTLDYSVKVALCDKKGADWTEDEQKAARERLGITSASGVYF